VEKKEKQNICSECGCEKLVSDSDMGELVCVSCGLVLSNNLIDSGPEWRAFDTVQRENRPRAGAPLTLTIHDQGLSTSIGWRNEDALGRRMRAKDRYKFYRLRKWNRRSKVSESNHRNLANALSEMSKDAYKLNLPKNVLETASQIYRRALQEGFTRGRTIRSVAATSLYVACRQCNVIRSLEDIAKGSNIPKKEIARTYRFLVQNMDTEVPLFSHRNYISKYVSRLGLCGVTEKMANDMLKKASEMRLTSGRGPGGITAACVYIASHITGECRTQGDIARTAQVTEVTIRNRYKELMEALNIAIKL
jgi:transcription initiation factor TFIIB